MFTYLIRSVGGGNVLLDGVGGVILEVPHIVSAFAIGAEHKGVEAYCPIDFALV